MPVRYIPLKWWTNKALNILSMAQILPLQDGMYHYPLWYCLRILATDFNPPTSFRRAYYFCLWKEYQLNYGRQQVEPAVRFHHIYEVNGDPDRFDVTFQTYTQQHAYQMKLLTSIAYGSTTINIDYQDGSDSEHYNYAKAINIRDNGTLIRKINLEQHQGILHYHGSGNLPFSTLDKITLLGSNGITSETYQCGYTSSSASFGGTDHWGNLNYRSDIHNVGCLNLLSASMYPELPLPLT